MSDTNETKLREALIALHDAAEDARNMLANAGPPITRSGTSATMTLMPSRHHHKPGYHGKA